MIESSFVQVEGVDRPFTISSELLGRIKMQRDMEVIRKILRAVQNKNDLKPEVLKVEGLDDFTIGYHVALLHEAGYVEGPSIRSNSLPYNQVLVRDLTWQGHEFAGAILSDESTWDKVKTALGAERLISMPLKVVQEIATKELTEWGLRALHHLQNGGGV
jgi:Hypothetical protein (DUF2513)